MTLVDFFHAAEQLRAAVDTAYGEHDPRGRSRYESNERRDDPVYVGPEMIALCTRQLRFSGARLRLNFRENWLNPVVYGWHLGVDLDGEQGYPRAAVTDGSVATIRHFDVARQEEDYWGNGLALLGDDPRPGSGPSPMRVLLRWRP